MRMAERIARLERHHTPEVPEITRIIIEADGSSTGVVMERQSNGVWKHYPITTDDAQEGETR